MGFTGGLVNVCTSMLNRSISIEVDLLSSETTSFDPRNVLVYGVVLVRWNQFEQQCLVLAEEILTGPAVLAIVLVSQTAGPAAG